MDDNSLMPWGKYQGEKMINVPATYLLWLLENNKCSGDVKKYIEDNKEVLQAQIKQAAKERGYNNQQYRKNIR